MNGRRDLSRDLVVRKSADQADGHVGRSGRDDREIRILGVANVKRAMEATTWLDELATFTKGIERVGVDTQRY